MFTKQSPSHGKVQVTYKKKLFDEFLLDISLSQDSKQIYDNLCKEKKLFIYSTYENLMFDNKWRYCVVNKNSFNALLNEGSLIEENDLGLPMCAVAERFGGTLRTGNHEIGESQFIRLLTNSSAIDKSTLMQMLCVLCQLDAYTTLELILKNARELSVDLSVLLSMALQCLNLSTVQLLIKLDAQLLHKSILITNDTDNGFKVFGSPLFFALFLPLNPQCMIGRYDQVVKLDHPKLVKLIMYLLSIGAKPEQKCILTHGEALNLDELTIIKEAGIEQLEKAEEREKIAMEIAWDCKILAKNYLDHETSKTLSTVGLVTLKNLAEYTATSISSSRFFSESLGKNERVKANENIEPKPQFY